MKFLLVQITAKEKKGEMEIHPIIGVADAKNQEEAIGIFSRNTKHQLNSNRKFEILCHKLEDIPVMTL